MIKRKFLRSTILLAFALSLPSTGVANPEKTDQLLIQTGTPKRSIETSFSSMVSWQKEGINFNKANGLTFIKGTDAKKPITAVEVAKKVAGSLNAAIKTEAPSDRGAIAEISKDKAEFLISNIASYAIDRITTRDYTNQALSYSVPGKSFSAASVDISINLVYTAVVEYIRDFATDIKLETAGGTITITLDNDAPIVIQTKGKSTEQLEVEMANVLGSKAVFSSTPIYPNFTEIRSKNYKAFDGGEVQLLGLNAKSITIDIDDSGLGVLTKFRFPYTKAVESDSGNIFTIIGLLLIAGIAFFFYSRKNRQAV
jgi:LPXTG-motif cell wall-anchored protein